MGRRRFAKCAPPTAHPTQAAIESTLIGGAQVALPFTPAAPYDGTSSTVVVVGFDGASRTK